MIYRGISLPDDSSRTAILDQALDVPRDLKMLWLKSAASIQDIGYHRKGSHSILVYLGKYLRSAASGPDSALVTLRLSRKAPGILDSFKIQPG